MEEIKNAAETTEAVTSEQVAVEETPIAEGVNEATATQEQSDAIVDNNVAEAPKLEQTKEENAEFARQRREKELQAKIDKAKEEARINAIIDVVGVNPYTQEPLKDEFDVKVYEKMKAYEKNGGDPVTDQAKIIKGIITEADQVKAETAKKEAAEKEANDKAQKDVQELQAAFPDLDVKALWNDERFQDYIDGRIGVKPLKQLYEGFRKIVGQTPAQETKVTEQVRTQANNNASVGSLKGEASVPSGLLTREQVAHMSRSEISAKWELVTKSMASWN